jgi:hypothetical protein
MSTWVGIRVLFLGFLAYYYRTTAREVKRLESTLRPAVFSRFIEGLPKVVGDYSNVPTMLVVRARAVKVAGRRHLCTLDNIRSVAVAIAGI